MKTNKPLTIDDVVYDNLAMSLSISTVITDKPTVNVNMRLKPYSEDLQQLQDNDISLCIPDAENHVSTDVNLLILEIETAVQKFINAKNI